MNIDKKNSHLDQSKGFTNTSTQPMNDDFVSILDLVKILWHDERSYRKFTLGIKNSMLIHYCLTSRKGNRDREKKRNLIFFAYFNIVLLLIFVTPFQSVSISFFRWEKKQQCRAFVGKFSTCLKCESSLDRRNLNEKKIRERNRNRHLLRERQLIVARTSMQACILTSVSSCYCRHTFAVFTQVHNWRKQNALILVSFTWSWITVEEKYHKSLPTLIWLSTRERSLTAYVDRTRQATHTDWDANVI